MESGNAEELSLRHYVEAEWCGGGSGARTKWCVPEDNEDKGKEMREGKSPHKCGDVESKYA